MTPSRSPQVRAVSQMVRVLLRYAQDPARNAISARTCAAQVREYAQVSTYTHAGARTSARPRCAHTCAYLTGAPA